MNWENIILALGSSFITGMITLLGTMLITKSNEKTALINSKSAIKQEFMQQKLICYKKLLNCLFYIENNISDENVIKNSDIENVWIDNYIYFHKNVSKHIWNIICKPEINLKPNIKSVKNDIKREINDYFDIKEDAQNTK